MTGYDNGLIYVEPGQACFGLKKMHVLTIFCSLLQFFKILKMVLALRRVRNNVANFPIWIFGYKNDHLVKLSSGIEP